MPLVTVIMPSYNHERYISEAIESVLNQTFSDFELIIIDDASKDKSKEIIKIYKEKESRIRAIFHDENKGIARTMNEGLEKANGKFIALFSSDDLWVRDKLVKQLNILMKDDNLIVWSEGLIIDEKGVHSGKKFTQMHEATKKKRGGNIFEELLRGNFICGQSVILKKENLKNIRYDERLKYLNDYKFMIDLAKNYNFYFISEPLAMYRIHGANTISSDRYGWSEDRILVGKYFLQKYGERLQNKIKSKINFNISNGYSNIGKRKEAIYYLYQAIMLNPFCYENLIYAIISLTNEDGNIRKFLRSFYQKLFSKNV